jgi:hypothetical protein
VQGDDWPGKFLYLPPLISLSRGSVVTPVGAHQIAFTHYSQAGHQEIANFAAVSAASTLSVLTSRSICEECKYVYIILSSYRNTCRQGRPGKIRGPVQNFKMRVSKLIMYIDCNILGSNQIYQEYG